MNKAEMIEYILQKTRKELESSSEKELEEFLKDIEPSKK